VQRTIRVKHRKSSNVTFKKPVALKRKPKEGASEKGSAASGFKA